MGAVGVLLVLQVLFAGQAVPCLIDTGSPVTLLEARYWLGMEASAPLGRGGVQAVGGDPVMGHWHSVPEVQVGRLVWRDVAVLELPDDRLPGGVPCIVGMNLLGRQPLVFRWDTAELSEAPRLD